MTGSNRGLINVAYVAIAVIHYVLVFYGVFSLLENYAARGAGVNIAVATVCILALGAVTHIVITRWRRQEDV